MDEQKIEEEKTLDSVVKLEGLPEEIRLAIKKSFDVFYAQALEWNTKAKELKVTDSSQVREMSMARTARLALRDIRLQANNKRKEMKEDSNRYGKAVQECYNFIEELVSPTESYLEDQEKFAERELALQKRELANKRLEELTPFGFIQSTGVNLEEMDELMYGRLLSGLKSEHETKLLREQKEQQEKEQYEREEKLRWVRADMLKPYYEFFTEKEGLHLGQIPELEWLDIFNDCKEKKEKHDEEQEAIRLENERLKKEKETKLQREKVIAEMGFVYSYKEKLYIIQHKYNDTRLTLDDSIFTVEDETFSQTIGGLKIFKSRFDKEAEEQDKILNERFATRTKELRPYIVYIRDYNKTLNLPEEEYQKELADLNTAAMEQIKFDAKEKAKADAKEKDRLAKEMKAKADADALKKEQEEQKAKEKAEAKAKKAPIKKQLKTWVDSFSIGKPTTENETSAEIELKFEGFKKWANDLIENM